MWLMGDIIEATQEELRHRGLDQWGMPLPGRSNSCNTNTTTTSNDSTFPLVINHSKKVNQKAENIYNITLTDDQFERLLDTIKSLYR